MAGIKTFEELLVWQKAHEYVLEVYKVTKDFPRSEEFGLKSQWRRSSASVASNIVEGFKRKYTKDSCHFYNVSQGSLEESKYHCRLSKDLGYISLEDYERLSILSDVTGRLLNGWIKIQK